MVRGNQILTATWARYRATRDALVETGVLADVGDLLVIVASSVALGQSTGRGLALMPLAPLVLPNRARATPPKGHVDDVGETDVDRGSDEEGWRGLNECGRQRGAAGYALSCNASAECDAGGEVLRLMASTHTERVVDSQRETGQSYRWRLLSDR